MGEIIHGIDDPVPAPPVMRFPLDTVDYGITHDYVGGGHIDLGSKDTRPIGEFPRSHAGEKIQVFFHGTIAPGTFTAGFREGAPVLADLLGIEVAHVCLTPFYELHREIIEGLEIIGCKVQAVPPIETEPLHVSDDGFDVFHGLSCGIGVIHPKVASTAVLGRYAEIETYRLGMTYMEITVGLWWKTGNNGIDLPQTKVFVDDVPDKIAGGMIIATHLLATLLP